MTSLSYFTFYTVLSCIHCYQTTVTEVKYGRGLHLFSALAGAAGTSRRVFEDVHERRLMTGTAVITNVWTERYIILTKYSCEFNEVDGE